jgi:hypothetical protein
VCARTRAHAIFTHRNTHTTPLPASAPPYPGRALALRRLVASGPAPTRPTPRTETCTQNREAAFPFFLSEAGTRYRRVAENLVQSCTQNQGSLFPIIAPLAIHKVAPGSLQCRSVPAHNWRAIARPALVGVPASAGLSGPGPGNHPTLTLPGYASPPRCPQKRGARDALGGLLLPCPQSRQRAPGRFPEGWRLPSLPQATVRSRRTSPCPSRGFLCDAEPLSPGTLAARPWRPEVAERQAKNDAGHSLYTLITVELFLGSCVLAERASRNRPFFGLTFRLASSA